MSSIVSNVKQGAVNTFNKYVNFLDKTLDRKHRKNLDNATLATLAIFTVGLTLALIPNSIIPNSTGHLAANIVGGCLAGGSGVFALSLLTRGIQNEIKFVQAYRDKQRAENERLAKDKT